MNLFQYFYMYITDINFLVTCIWGYMGCAKQGKKPDKDCKEDFNGCSMIAMGMAPLSIPLVTVPKLPLPNSSPCTISCLVIVQVSPSVIIAKDVLNPSSVSGLGIKQMSVKLVLNRP